MKKTYLFIGTLVCSLAVCAQTFTLKSTELGGQATNKQVLNGFGCNGENNSPQLFWEHPPKDTKSFAVTLFDESAPTGSGWWHWLIFDIPKDVRELKP
ncbi:MAG TPA: YbhB/YbcL family Raf kinase inhibitor-like protein, partial [Bacteroidia bacterium]|nr:YbhB/YbcL family Raf kinase inhibitor-like protein [Bacteroidia bacterium]